MFPAEADAVRSTLETIGDEAIRNQMTTPVALTQMLPVGVMGLFCAMMIAAAISTDGTYLHSWGVIFIQDVVLPLRKNREPLSPRQHMRLLRLSIIGVAAFGWIFSMVFPLKDYIMMFMAITGAIFLGGAGNGQGGSRVDETFRDGTD